MASIPFLAKLALKSLLPTGLECTLSLVNLGDVLGPIGVFSPHSALQQESQRPIREGMFPLYMQTLLLKILFWMHY